MCHMKVAMNSKRPKRMSTQLHAAPAAIQRSRCARRRRRSVHMPVVPCGPKVAATAKIWGLSKKTANYRPAPMPEVRCDRCKYMFPPLALGGCRLVRGPIQGSATCNEFTPRRTGGA